MVDIRTELLHLPFRKHGTHAGQHHGGKRRDQGRDDGQDLRGCRIETHLLGTVDESQIDDVQGRIERGQHVIQAQDEKRAGEPPHIQIFQ